MIYVDKSIDSAVLWQFYAGFSRALKARKKHGHKCQDDDGKHHIITNCYVQFKYKHPYNINYISVNLHD